MAWRSKPYLTPISIAAGPNAIPSISCALKSIWNLVELHRDLCSGGYKTGRSTAFVVTHPKIREVWATEFRDRVVHGVIYNVISDRKCAKIRVRRTEA